MCRPSRSLLSGLKSLSNSALQYLIADLHLDGKRPETTRLFLDFIDGPAREAARLYILGDLFEAWIGDDAAGRLGRQVANRLASLSRAGTRIYFLCGNRDFLVGPDYCRRAGMSRLDEPVSLIEHRGETIALLHGDTLCTDDVSYQNFRRKARSPQWQKKMLAKPVWMRKLMAGAARLMSRRHTGSTAETIMDVNPGAVEEAFVHHRVRRMIHGHTHRRAIHDLQVDGRHCQRIVLGDWGETGSVVRLDNNPPAMLKIARNSDNEVTLLLQETAAPLAD